MNYVDIILVIPVLWFAYQGFKRGFVIEFASLAALVLGIYAALYFSGYAAEIITNNFNLGSKYVPVISFIITFVIIVFLVYLVGKLLEKVINMVALGFLNKLAGGIFGILKAALFMSIVLVILNHFNANLISTEKKQGSLFYTPIEVIAPALWQHIKEWNDPQIQELNKDVEEIAI